MTRSPAISNCNAGHELQPISSCNRFRFRIATDFELQQSNCNRCNSKSVATTVAIQNRFSTVAIRNHRRGNSGAGSLEPVGPQRSPVISICLPVISKSLAIDSFIHEGARLSQCMNLAVNGDFDLLESMNRSRR